MTFFHTIKYVYEERDMCYNLTMQKLIEFESGLKFIYVPNHAVRSVALGVFVKAGVVTETADIMGISHFIEHMVFKGTTKRSSFDIVNEIDCIGAQINAFTSKSYTCFHTVSLDSNVKKCIDVLADLYFNPTFLQEELEKERKVVLEEINECEDTPDDVCFEMLGSAFFEGNPLGKVILGTKETLKNMTSDTLREYHQKYYVPQNTILVLAGNIEEGEAISLAREYFEDKFVDVKPFEYPVPPKAQLHNKFVKKKKKIEQSHLAFAFPCVSYGDDGVVAMQLMSLIFGMGMSSRLFQSVRERLGACYTIAGYPSTYQTNGSYTIYTSTSPKMVEQTVCAIRDEIDLLLEKGVTDEELEKGKEQLKTSFVLGQESTSAMMRSFGSHAIMSGGLFDVDKRIEAIDNTTAEDVNKIAKEIFNFEGVCASLVSSDVTPDIVKLIKREK